MKLQELLKSMFFGATSTAAKTIGVQNLAQNTGATAPGRNAFTGSIGTEAWRFQPPIVYTFSWTSIPVGFTSTAASAIVTPTVNTHYDVLVTDPVTGCTKTDFIDVAVNAVPTVSASPTTSNVCSPGGTASVLTASILQQPIPGLQLPDWM